MPAPIALTPIAFRLATLAAVAGLAIIAARRRTDAPLDDKREAALDAAPEAGEFATRLGRGEARADAARRWRRTIRFGRRGLEIDLAGLARARFRTV
ncbi:hypothetical protein N8071_00010 [bacterium]|nr:hypothetical protein [bacterium]